MWNSIIAIITIIVALVVAIMGVTMSPENLHFPMFVSRFFEIMIPVLVVGALVKYLCSCPGKEKA